MTRVLASPEVIRHHAQQHVDRCEGGTHLDLEFEFRCPCGGMRALVCFACLKPVFVVVDPAAVLCVHAAELTGFAA